MTTEQQPPTVPRPARRRPWLWIVIAGTAVAVVLVAVLIGAEMTNNRQNSATGTSAPHAILARMLSQTNDTAVTAGGTWTFEDKSAWDPTDTSGYIGDPCSGSASGAQHY
jgi:hypothetical protein